jgi:putative ABC transport system permease protein
MRALDRKLVRELWRLRGQVIAVAMVVASGVAVLVMSLSTLEALQETALAYYDRYGFADVFASVKRAPEQLAGRIAAIPGVQTVETRISRFAILDVEDFAEPIMGRLVSIPERGEPVLNRLALRAGRWVSPDRPDEVVLNEPFAEAHGLGPGDRLAAIMNGNKRTLEVVGTALSPEFVYAIGPGALMPDNKRFGIMWMGREALAAAYDLDGAFDDVTLTLQRGAAPEPVIRRIDALLAPYGGVGAIARADQESNWFLINEIRQLRTMTTILPTVFLAVAAFLTSMVIGRLVATERSEIGLMKAFGYNTLEIGWHYAKFVIAMAAVGVVVGWGLGAWLGRQQTEMYTGFFRFPLFLYRPGPTSFALGAVVSIGAALAGSLRAVRAAVRLAPAESMRPPAPESYHHGGIGDGLTAWLDQPTRIVLRQIRRYPVRAALTSAAVACSVALVVVAIMWTDAMSYLIDTYFFQAQRQNVTIGLVEPQSTTALHEIGRLPGVMLAEPMRLVAAELRAGPRSHRGAITGVPAAPLLQPIYDVRRGELPVPPDGLVMSTALAKKLAVGLGDRVEVQVLTGRRPLARLPVVGLVETHIGQPAYMRLDALDRLLRERPSLQYANLYVDESESPALFAELKALPEIASVSFREAAVRSFHETIGDTLLLFVGFFSLFASALGFGVVYNSTRIALSERGRELATLRVLGFTRREVSYILFAEVGVLVVLGLPLGCGLGWLLGWIMMQAFETELYRMPLVIDPSTYGSAALIALAATAISAAIVRRRLDHLDLIAVLKTRE